MATNYCSTDSRFQQSPKALERRYIELDDARYGCITTLAWIVGDYGVYSTTWGTPKRHYAVAHIASKRDLADYSRLKVAIQFAGWMMANVDMNSLAKRFFNNAITPADEAMIEVIKSRRLHVCYLPREYEIEWIQTNHPDWFKRRHGNVVLSDSADARQQADGGEAGE